MVQEGQKKWIKAYPQMWDLAMFDKSKRAGFESCSVSPQANEATGEYCTCVVDKAASAPPTGLVLIWSKRVICPSIKRWISFLLHPGSLSAVHLVYFYCYYHVMSGKASPQQKTSLLCASVPTFSMEKLLAHFDHWLFTWPQREIKPHNQAQIIYCFVVFVVFLYILIILTK